jgi:hypothetical protein
MEIMSIGPVPRSSKSKVEVSVKKTSGKSYVKDSSGLEPRWVQGRRVDGGGGK